MYINESVEENLRFLILEVQQQLQRTAVYIDDPSLDLLDSILSRDDYIDNLKTVIQRKCFSAAASPGNDGSSHVEHLKAIVVVAANLERIADFCEKIIKQLTYIEHNEVLEEYDFGNLFASVMEGVSLIEKVVLENDAKLAITLCAIERRIDDLFAGMFKRILSDLSSSTQAQSLVTVLFIGRYLERMGDSLLNIGEAAMSAFLGERIKIGQFDALEEALDAANLSPQISNLSLEAMGETKSGCRIDLVSSRQVDGGATMVIFKEGRRQKLEKEKSGVEYWDAMMPGIAPTIYAHHQDGDTGALLFEYLDGATYEQILMKGNAQELGTALDNITATMQTVWKRTQRMGGTPVEFIAQIRTRLDDIYTVHPGFALQDGYVGKVSIPSFEDLLESAAKIESQLCAPFRVLVHGDFNIDNVIFDTKSNRVRYIDLHRAAMQDYVQDVSVFLVSNFRMQVFDPAVRTRINQSVLRFKKSAADFAREIGDHTFECRLALGIARSFVTSTRFVLDKEFATDMLLRSRYLLEDIVANAGRRPEKYRLPEEILVD